MPKKENKKQLEAFEIYYKLGAQRTLPKVAKEYSKSLAWVKGVSAHFKWSERVKERDRKVSAKVLDSVDDALVKAKKDNLDIIHAVKVMLSNKIKRMDAENRDMDVSLTEFERLAKLELLMLGDPTERISDDTITGLVKRAAELRRNRSDSKGH